MLVYCKNILIVCYVLVCKRLLEKFDGNGLIEFLASNLYSACDKR